ncbi:MAG: Jag N-terminal domain-containing protein [Campylobacterales bacterium]|nr:Jag N-terminal domain-containing protein [Campylobacterales bacterium]
MKQFEAQGLEEVYELATAEFECSITDLYIEIIQQPTKGFFGLFKKKAIIKVSLKDRPIEKPRNNTFTKPKASTLKIADVSTKIEAVSKKEKSLNTKKEKITPKAKISSKEEIFDNFYSKDENEELSKLIVKKDKEDIINEVKIKVNELFAHTCYDINEIIVDFYDEETLYIEFSGADCALLIGKEGYRYKALSYILFNWINEKYSLMLRLEVAQFLKNQEESIYNYLNPVIVAIKETGTFKTKPLDGILVHIALKKLRDEFPDKYVAVKTNVKGDKYVLVNEYKSKNA